MGSGSASKRSVSATPHASKGYIPPLSQLAKIFFHYPNLFSYSFIIQTSLLNYFIIITHSFILTSSDHILEQYYFLKYIYFNCPRPLRNNCCASMNLSKMIVLLWHVLSIYHKDKQWFGIYSNDNFSEQPHTPSHPPKTLGWNQSIFVAARLNVLK